VSKEADVKLIEAGLVDSRVRHTNLNIPVIHPTLPLERVYCINCSRPYGWVTTESYSYIAVNNIVVLCDVCEQILGKPQLQEAKIKLVPTEATDPLAAPVTK